MNKSSVRRFKPSEYHSPSQREKAGVREHRWWKRQELGLWLPPFSAADPQLLEFLRDAGWLDNTNAAAH